MTLREQSKFGEAIIAYRKAIQIDPKHADFRIGLSLALIKIGNFTEAAKAMQMGHDLLPAGHWMREVLQGDIQVCANLQA